MCKDAIAAIVLALAAPSFLSGCGLARSKEISAATSPAQLAQFRDKDLCNPHVEETAVVLKERAARNLGDCSVEHVQCVRTGFAPGTDGYLRCRERLEMAKIAREGRRAQDSDALMSLGLQMMQPPPAPPRPTICTNYGMQTVCQ